MTSAFGLAMPSSFFISNDPSFPRSRQRANTRQQLSPICLAASHSTPMLLSLSQNTFLQFIVPQCLAGWPMLCKLPRSSPRGPTPQRDVHPQRQLGRSPPRMDDPLIILIEQNVAHVTLIRCDLIASSQLFNHPHAADILRLHNQYRQYHDLRHEITIHDLIMITARDKH